MKIVHAAARGSALFLGSYAVLNIIAGLRSGAANLNIWWLDLRPLSPMLSNLVLVTSGILLVLFGLLPRLSPGLRKTTLAFVLFLAVVSMCNTIHFYYLAIRGTFTPGIYIPLSLIVFGALCLVLYIIKKDVEARGALLRLLVVAVLVASAPLSQIYFFGKSDYRRKADAIVVFGAGVSEDGRLCHALADRMRTGCELFLQGYADTMILTGGPGPGEMTEPEAMKAYAVDRGVPGEAIIIDEDGSSTIKSVHNTSAVFSKRDIEKVLAVSSYFHLPRIKMLYGGEGIEVYTVPAEETNFLLDTPYLLARETAALWYYYGVLVME